MVAHQYFDMPPPFPPPQAGEGNPSGTPPKPKRFRRGLLVAVAALTVGGGAGSGAVAAALVAHAAPVTAATPATTTSVQGTSSSATAESVYAQENADTRLPVMGANHTVLRWGNPYTNFVGYVNGSDWTPTGFGVYWPVILDLAHRYGLPNAIGGEGFAPSRIYSKLAAGHPVQVWIQTRFARVPLGTWTAWDGTQVRYSYAEHSVTLSGVSPTQVRVNDVLNASQYWVDKPLFEANFADFNNMAVIFQ